MDECGSGHVTLAYADMNASSTRTDRATEPVAPLADRMRPRTLDEVIGQSHLLGADKPLRQALDSGRLHSMVFWGPPGTGKTTLARVVASCVDAHFRTLSAVTSGVKDIREAVKLAELERESGIRTVLFVDEVHRFNKGQQDAFLPYIENGTINFIGATTENPSFELNRALLSRVRVYVLEPLTTDELRQIASRALNDESAGLADRGLEVSDEAIDFLSDVSGGDARRFLSLLEIAADLSDNGGVIDVDEAKRVSGRRIASFDKGGDIFYDQISALHKSIRGSNPDAALYWLSRMLDGGCDPHYLLRRLLRIASEDIGNADPRALRITLDAWETFDRLGSPEGELAIAQAAIFLAVAAKSNAAYLACNAAMADARDSGDAPVPVHIRNAPTGLARSMGHGADYRYDHDEADAFAAGQRYFPEDMGEKVYYQPVERGLESKIAEKLKNLRSRRSSQNSS